jgi:hypothetical protein
MSRVTWPGGIGRPPAIGTVSGVIDSVISVVCELVKVFSR